MTGMGDERIERAREFLARDGGKPYQWGGSAGSVDASTFVASTMAALAESRTVDVDGSTMQLAAPDSRWPRVDLICRTPEGQQVRDGQYVDEYTLLVVTGEPAPEPVRPAVPVGYAVVAAIRVPPQSTPNRAERRR